MNKENTINLMVPEMLKKLFSMADNPWELGKYITNQTKELIGCNSVMLIYHNTNAPETHHQLIGICPEIERVSFKHEIWSSIADLSHELHIPALFRHENSNSAIEKLLSQIPGNYSILVPLEYLSQRLGLLAIIDLVETNKSQSVIDSFDLLSGILAIELRNANNLQNLESMIDRRTQELTSSERRFKSILEQATDSMYICDFNGQISDVNQQACRSLGYSKEELLQLKILDIDILLSDTEKMTLLFKQIKFENPYRFETYLKRKNGDTFPVEVNSSIIDLNGVNHILGFARDISERKEAEEHIKKIGDHYKALIEKAPDGIVLIDPEGKFKFISPSARKIFGYSVDEVVNVNPANLTHPDDLPLVLSLLKNLIANPQQTPGIPYRFRTKDGQWKWIESTFTNMLSDPSVEAIVINFRDISDRKKNEEEIQKLNEHLEQNVKNRTLELENRSHELSENQAALLNLVEDLNIKSEELQQSTIMLKAANKELEAFSYSVSHDLRAPLRAIGGFVRILLEDYEKVLDDEGIRICKIIHSNALKMGQLIDDLLSFSRLIRSELHNSVIDMNYLVNDIIKEMDISNYSNQRTISIEELPLVHGDRNLIKQVWINLISNAIKYSSKTDHAEILIGSNKKEYEINYFIKDNGVGFNMDYSHKLFGVFQRLHGSNEFEGTGVGLAIVQRIISRHGGRTWAEGEIGKGACFYFSLPIIEKNSK